MSQRLMKMHCAGSYYNDVVISNAKNSECDKKDCMRVCITKDTNDFKSCFDKCF